MDGGRGSVDGGARGLVGGCEAGEVVEVGGVVGDDDEVEVGCAPDAAAAQGEGMRRDAT